MNWFDAVCHAFAVMALGGFSTHDASVGYFNSPAIEAVLIVFMLIAAMNFGRHFIAWQQKSLRTYATDTEAKAMLAVIGLSIIGLSLYIWYDGVYPSFWTCLRHVAFNLVSLATDCGFVNQDYAVWPMFAPMWILMLSCYCANTGSTGGGIKMFRSLVLFRQAARELMLLVHPQAVRPVKIGGQVVQNQIVFAVLAFVVLYFGVVVVLTFSLLASGLDFLSAFSAIIACINNAGPGLGVVGPAGNYQGLTDFQTWICSLAMMLGRLEIFSVLVLLTPSFWRK
jgi:trk system potassium uptake protein TrkH